MKLLQIHAEFMLPDDFQGNLSEALMEMAKYCGNEKPYQHLPVEDKNISIGCMEQNMLKELCERYKISGNRFVGSCFVGTWPA